ncbi:helix-turn-helix transcriptional regulator [Pseudonocardia sp. MCCB 268]|nr:helix-turn-helix transcriptional regulator [Pseudonocardia cytotoxica]
MGHREGCWPGQRGASEKGFGRTTARDVVAASGTNLASIGYHFGSGRAAHRGPAGHRGVGRGAGPRAGRARAARDVRPGAAGGGHLEPGHQPVHHPAAAVGDPRRGPRPGRAAARAAGAARRSAAEVREGLALTLHPARRRPGGRRPAAAMLGSVYQALLTGVMVQWMLDRTPPERRGRRRGPARSPSAPTRV